ncbi:MAG: xanthine dehydrogenase family protein subunit M [Candidatus Bipolaricaulota bacterium]
MRSLEGLSVERPASLKKAVELLSDGGQALAGGTDLVVRLGRAQEKPQRLVYLGRIPELTSWETAGDHAEIGAAVTHAEILASPLAKHLPILRQALSSIGGPAIRAAGTLGGNVANASPAADGLIPLYLLDAKLRISGAEGERVVPVSSFVRGPGLTDLQPAEVIRSIVVTFPKGSPLSYFRKVGRRRALVIAIASLGALVWVNEGEIRQARLALGSVAPTVLRPQSLEQALPGRPLQPRALEDLAQELSQATRPIDDLRAPGEYRRQVSGSLLLDMTEVLSTAA